MDRTIRAGKLYGYKFEGDLLLNSEIRVIKPDNAGEYSIEIDCLMNVTCNCLGFQHREECKHSELVEKELEMIIQTKGSIGTAVTVRRKRPKLKAEKNLEIIANLLIDPKASLRNTGEAVDSQGRLTEIDKVAIGDRIADIVARIEGLQFDIRSVNMFKSVRKVRKRFIRRTSCAKS